MRSTTTYHTERRATLVGAHRYGGLCGEVLAVVAINRYTATIQGCLWVVEMVMPVFVR